MPLRILVSTVLVLGMGLSCAAGESMPYYRQKLQEAELLLDRGQYQRGCALMRGAVFLAAESGDYGSAYWYAWKTAKRKPAVPGSEQRLKWYDLAERYWKMRDTNHPMWHRTDLPNYIQMLCEKETIYAGRGAMGMAFQTINRAEVLVDRHWRDLEEGSWESPRTQLELGVYTSLLLDRADHRKRSGRLRESEQSFLHCLAVTELMEPGYARTKTQSRTLNNLVVLLDLEGRDRDAGKYREAALAIKADGAEDLIVQANSLRNDSRVQGPSQALFQQLMEKADALEEAGKRSYALSIRRRAASVLSEMDRNDEAAVLFEQVITEARDSGLRAIAADAYFWRGKARSRHQLEGAEDDFYAALDFYRQEGIKPNECRVYKAYAGYLAANDRIPEALIVVNEALRLNEMMEMMHRRPELLALQARILFQAGEQQLADAAWDAALALAESVENLSDYQKFLVLIEHLQYLASCGRDTEMAGTAARIESLIAGTELTEYQSREYRAFNPDDYRTPPPAPLPALTAVDLQPVYSATRVPDSQEADSWFWLMNSTPYVQTGRLEIRGAEAQRWNTNAASCIEIIVEDGGPETESGIAVALPAHGTLAVHATYVNPPDDRAERLVLVWNGTAVREATWDVVADADQFTPLTTWHAHLAQQNPFYSIPLYHKIGVRDASGTHLNFRMRAATPCRIETYDADSALLIAVDAEGDGSYTGGSDMLIADRDLDDFPDVSQAGSSIIFHVFPAETISEAHPLDLTVEVLVNREWIPVGTDRLIPPHMNPPAP